MKKKRKRLSKRLIVLEIDERLHELCKQFGSNPKELFKQIQQDFLGIQETERNYEVILAQLLLSEILAHKAKVDRGSVEPVLDYMRSYHAQMKKDEAIPFQLSEITQSILQECNYDKKHTNN